MSTVQQTSVEGFDDSLNPAPEGQEAPKVEKSGLNEQVNVLSAPPADYESSDDSNDDWVEMKVEEKQDLQPREQVKQDDESRLSMEGLLKQARISFEKWIDIKKPHNYPMPNGIVFLTSIKGCFGWGAEAGTGIVLYRLNNNNNGNGSPQWSGPCAIGSGGLSFGLQIGVSKVDDIIMLPRKHHVRTFTSKGQLKLGGSSELTVVNIGGKAQGSFNISSKEASDIHSYSMDTKGLSIGASVEGAVIRIRSDCNNKFYGKNTSVEDIADGKVNIRPYTNKDYDRIIELLNKHFKIYRKRLPLARAPLPPVLPPVLVAPAVHVVHPRPIYRPHHHVPAPVKVGPIIGAAVAVGVVDALVHGVHGPHRPHRPHRGHRGHGLRRGHH